MTLVTIFRPRRMETAIIRVNAEPDGADAMLEEGFWPDDVTYHPWINKRPRGFRGQSNQHRDQKSPHRRNFDKAQ